MLYVKASAIFTMILASDVGAVPVQHHRVEEGQLQARVADASPAAVKKLSNGTVSTCAEVKAKGLCLHKLAKAHCGETCVLDKLNDGAGNGEEHLVAALLEKYPDTHACRHGECECKDEEHGITYGGLCCGDDGYCQGYYCDNQKC